MTDLELKLALAKELPELIEHTEYIPFGGDGSFVQHNFFWKRNSGKLTWRESHVTDREWDWVVNEVIANSNVSTELENLAPNLNWGNATWQQRAESYLKVIGKQ